MPDASVPAPVEPGKGGRDPAERAPSPGEGARTLHSRDASAAALGIELLAASPDQAVTRMRVRPDMCNGFDIIHGGMTFLLADSAMAFASNAGAGTAGSGAALASSAEIDWLAPVPVGEVLTATAVRRWSSGRSAIWDITVANAAGEPVAVVRGRTRHVARTT